MPRTNIKILSYIYRLVFTPGFADNHTGGNPNCPMEKVVFATHTITVDEGAAERDETVLHGIIHAVDRHWDIGLEEPQVRRLSEGLYHVLKENKIDFSKEGVFP